MNDQEIRTFEMFKGVGLFNAAHISAFTPISLARQLFNIVAASVGELEALAAAESSAGGSKRQNTAGRAVARETLRQKMEAIRRTARAMAFTLPGLEDKFRIPRGGSDQALINTARAFAQDALPLKDEFVRHELPQSFIEDLNAAIASLENSMGGQSASKGAGKSASASIDGAIERGLDAVRRLDPIIRNKFSDEPAVLAEWESARRIRRGPRSQADGGANNEQPAQPPTP
ncbi:MAG TPA: hypothetical protein VGX48_15785 [Pyrinomonadaceae bacterium]|jgi:hypothetical protein|nr:hypothetical protein [Pyrinomonadaceae bacterium]